MKKRLLSHTESKDKVAIYFWDAIFFRVLNKFVSHSHWQKWTSILRPKLRTFPYKCLVFFLAETGESEPGGSTNRAVRFNKPGVLTWVVAHISVRREPRDVITSHHVGVPALAVPVVMKDVVHGRSRHVCDRRPALKSVWTYESQQRSDVPF